MTASSFYDLKTPTVWTQPPPTFSFSSLQALRSCPRRWQLVHSSWGSLSKFPERPQPAAIEGQIVHAALDLLARELGRRGRPPIGSPAFGAILERCAFWQFFAAQVDEWNRRLADHPRAGPRYVLRTPPRDLANQAVRLFRERYQPGVEQPFDTRDVESRAGPVGSASPLALLHAVGTISELRLEHPSLPVVGVLDLVALERNRSAVVVDFKTGACKPAHEEQVRLYGLLWWRATGTRPGKAVVQYLDSARTLELTEAELLATEKSISKEIKKTKAALQARPASGSPGQECTWCPVRPRCEEGWAWGERAPRAAPNGRSIDIEVTIASDPTPTGFLGARSKGDDVSIVFDAAVGRALPSLSAGDRFRIVDAAPRSAGKEIAVLPWTEMYRV